ncbi:MAG: MarR family transcriptional regulator [Hyphomicrobiales bacterium]|nr:MAG: MarR family transcriptional regulator [Hyphomicrobiales bacterium]
MNKAAKEKLKIENLLCFSIYSATHAMNQVYKPLLKKIGLTYPQYLVMVALWNEDEQTVGQLGDLLILESSTLTPLLKRLETRSHVKRQRDPIDERKVIVSLTQSGRSLQTKADDIPSCILNASKFNIDQVIKLHEQIIELRDNLLTIG